MIPAGGGGGTIYAGGDELDSNGDAYRWPDATASGRRHGRIHW
ncbi:Uncharacterised protein [Corynebacterium striatum]|nr:Uncharacterised protein [Corynebacterium striatum]